MEVALLPGSIFLIYMIIFLKSRIYSTVFILLLLLFFASLYTSQSSFSTAQPLHRGEREVCLFEPWQHFYTDRAHGCSTFPPLLSTNYGLHKKHFTCGGERCYRYNHPSPPHMLLVLCVGHYSTF